MKLVFSYGTAKWEQLLGSGCKYFMISETLSQMGRRNSRLESE
jgi:hypothetical protein